MSNRDVGVQVDAHITTVYTFYHSHHHRFANCRRFLAKRTFLFLNSLFIFYHLSLSSLLTCFANTKNFLPLCFFAKILIITHAIGSGSRNGREKTPTGLEAFKCSFKRSTKAGRTPYHTPLLQDCAHIRGKRRGKWNTAKHFTAHTYSYYF